MKDRIRRFLWRNYIGTRYYGIFKYHAELERSQWWSRDHLQELQLKKLKTLFNFAYNNVLYYRSTWDQIGFNPNDLNSIDVLKQLPTLDKHTLKERFSELSCDALVKNARLNSTGGSTGVPVHFYQDRHYFIFCQSASIRHDQWTGWKYGDPFILLWGAQKDIGYGLLKRISRSLAGDSIINAFQINEEVLETAYKVLISGRPTLLLGYATAIYAFAKYLEDSGKALKHNIKGIISSAEVLTEDNRELFERVFQVKVFNRYGSRELGLIASECEEGSMHVCDERVIVEYEKISNELKEITITELDNRVMPLIRYRTGDISSSSEKICECGRGLSLMNTIEGRTTSLMLTSRGDIISGPSLTLVFRDIKEVKQVQLYQSIPEKLIVRLVKGAGYDDNVERLISKRLQELFGYDTGIEFDYKDLIPVEQSGKYHYTISDIFPRIVH